MEQLMSFKKWFMLLCLEISYLLLGACFYYQIESVEETKRFLMERHERAEIEELLIFHYQPSMNSSQEDIFRKLTEYCGKPMHARMSHEEPAHRWDFYHSLFFVITVVSTIGYGNLAPTTMLGRIVMIFYGLVGIPVNGIVMVTLGGYFGQRIQSMYNRWKTDKIHNMTANLGLVSQITIYLLPGFLLLIFLPSVAIMIFEGWDYDVAVYYAFVTLTTIGFGDYVAGVEDNHFGMFLFTSYKIFLLVWIIIGLGYVVMVLGFISQGMRSKKIRDMEQMLVDNIRRTPVKFRALKSMIYEILLIRLKPVYKKSSVTPILHDGRAMSLPDLRLLYADFHSVPCRKRALSETDSKDLPIIQRGQSDSNLHLIDKDLTFLSKKEQQQHDLLKKMSCFMNSYELKLNQAQTGINGFTEEEILETERYNSQWTLGSAKNPSTPSMKSRAEPVAKVPSSLQTHSNESTWYGQTAARKEQEMRERMQHGRARSRTLPVQREPLLKLPPEGIISRLRRRFISTDSYKEKDVEKGEITGPQVPGNREFQPERSRKRTQSENVSLMGSNVLTNEEHEQVVQLAKMLFTLVDHDHCEPRRKVGNITPPEVSAARARRGPILPMMSRRGSLMPPSPRNVRAWRRFSLNPTDHILPPPLNPPLTRQRRFSLRPTVLLSNYSPSPVVRRIRRDNKDNKDNVIIEHKQMN